MNKIKMNIKLKHSNKCSNNNSNYKEKVKIMISHQFNSREIPVKFSQREVNL